MPPRRTRVLYVTDLAYEARGRRYCDEDIFLATQLREHFDIALCHPTDAVELMDSFDVVVVRNSGPVLYYQDHHDEFRARAGQAGVRVFTELTGKADMAGKQYLLDLYAAGYPVIPTVDRLQNIERLPPAAEYVAKPKFGADSVGLQFVQRERLSDLNYDNLLVQPRVDFAYEVSFYFVDHTFEYALYAPHADQRWLLEPYEPTDADLAFAQRFIDWNDVRHGIQRVDACRTRTGELLLVELEDLNPYLSLDRVAAPTRDAFIRDMTASIAAMAKKSPTTR
ncbi:hypothetical protein AB0C02_23855 [Micromonospora sp. NPDC048999]|uniref:hypothetical protein n=1 Tax=Micromonospora sp. NPDC048999 TaxID=3155391 RepID=UPI0033C1CA07